MADINEIDYVNPEERANTILLAQYKQSTNLKNYLGSFVKTLTPLMNANNQTVLTREIDTAFGDSLDKIGRVVGVSRIIQGATSLGLFGFYDNATAEGFGIGTFYSAGDKQSTDLILNDYQYRNYIRAKILINTRGGRIEDVLNYIQLLLNKVLDLEITETLAAFHVRVHATLPLSDKALLAVGAKSIKPIGITMTMEDDAGTIVLP